MSADWIAEYIRAHALANPGAQPVRIESGPPGWYSIQRGQTVSWRKYRRAEIEQMTQRLLARVPQG